MELSVMSSCQNITLKIRDFFQLPSEIGYFLDSPEIRFADDSYCLRVYPNGSQKYYGGDQTELCLVRLTSTFPERNVSCRFGFRGITGEGREFDGYLKSSAINKLRFYRSFIEEKKYMWVPGDTFTVLCSIHLREQSNTGNSKSKAAQTSEAEEEQEGLPGGTTLLSHYKLLLQKGAESDACFVVSGKEFRAHRCVLRARSTVFEAMFGHETAEKESGRVIINDLDPDCFGEFLEYLYTGIVGAGLSDDNAFGLYAAADKYDVPTLKSECVEHMRQNLSVDSFCEVITLALRHREEKLLQQAVQFFKDNMACIILTVKWQQFVIDNGTAANELLIKAIVPREQ